MLAVGLMSGTSLDGADAALVEIRDEHTLSLVAFHTRAYSTAERDQIRHAIGGGAKDLSLLDRDLGCWLAAAARELLDRAGVATNAVSLVGSHGQTVWHEPGRATLQLGCAATIAETLGVPVVSDFRRRDVAAGGQGAPLVPIADVMLWGHPDRGRLLLNIGGMANVTWVPRRGDVLGAVAFDTGPGVAMVDAVARLTDPSQPYDVGGARASRGTAVTEAVDGVLAFPYFDAAPPKSTGRELFGDQAARQLTERARQIHPPASDDDLVATAVEITARSITEQVGRWVVAGRDETELVASGGGARNPAIMRRLGALLDGWTIRRFDDLFFDGDAKEAAAFAYLGWRTINGLPGNVPRATGASGVRVLGTVTAA
jgi:anhydro-N-acetylmuramic acid kinase